MADLVSSVRPLTVRDDEPAATVAAMLERHQMDEAVVLDSAGTYLGLITGEKVLRWSRDELKRLTVKLRFEEDSARAAQDRPPRVPTRRARAAPR